MVPDDEFALELFHKTTCYDLASKTPSVGHVEPNQMHGDVLGNKLQEMNSCT